MPRRTVVKIGPQESQGQRPKVFQNLSARMMIRARGFSPHAPPWQRQRGTGHVPSRRLAAAGLDGMQFLIRAVLPLRLSLACSLASGPWAPRPPPHAIQHHCAALALEESVRNGGNTSSEIAKALGLVGGACAERWKGHRGRAGLRGQASAGHRPSPSRTPRSPPLSRGSLLRPSHASSVIRFTRRDRVLLEAPVPATMLFQLCPLLSICTMAALRPSSSGRPL